MRTATLSIRGSPVIAEDCLRHAGYNSFQVNSATGSSCSGQVVRLQMQQFARSGRYSLGQSALIGDATDYLARRGGDFVSEVGDRLAVGVQ
ncbi:hypothetical protein D3C81_1793750 [compost metagenome]